MFYGDREAAPVDPCGNLWWIATSKELPDQRRADARIREP